MKTRLIAVLGLALLTPLGAAAQEKKPVCAVMDAALPTPLAAWTTRTPLDAAATITGLEAATLTPGRAVSAALHPTPKVAYAAAPARAGGPATYGGLLGLTVDEPGTYRIVLSAPAWVDIVQNGKALASAAHQHGPACSTARKMVDFALARGPHVVQVAGSPDVAVGVLVIRAP